MIKKKNRIHIQVPLNSFYCDELPYFGNEKSKLPFFISYTWYKYLIRIAGSNACDIHCYK